MHRLLARQLKRYFGDDFRSPEEWHDFLQAISDVYKDFDIHREVVERSLVFSSEELHAANAEMRAIFQAIPDLLFRLDEHGTILDFRSGSTADLLLPRRELIGKRIQKVPIESVAQQFNEAIRRVLLQQQFVSIEYVLKLDGDDQHYEARLVPLPERQIVVIVQNISGRKQAEGKLQDAHKQLLETSRIAGMAEVATSVLHNVGNVLNSVNVSSSIIADHLRRSKVVNLAKGIELMREHAHDLPEFLTQDSRGKQLPGYLQAVAELLTREQEDMLREILSLSHRIEHIKEIVAMQQNYARVYGVLETLEAADLVEDALRLNAAALERHQVRVIREYLDVPPLLVDKHKVIQVLINLIRNAKYALDEKPDPDKRMTLRIAPGESGRITISVIDNGVGIPPENLTRIFQHGFTTRKEGHGFGLHSGALAAREMGGALRVQSEGVNKGAVFTLELPCRPEAK